MPPVSIPTSAALSPAQRLPATNPAVFKSLHRLSRPSLLSLVLDWLDDRNQELSAPYLEGDGNDDHVSDLYPPAQSVEELREYYTELQTQKGSKREVVDRILEGDWRNGVSLYQVAQADIQYLYDHPTSQRWTAFKVVQSFESTESGLKGKELPTIPRFHPPTFLENLQNEILPDVKAHYFLETPPHLPITILRIFLLSSPYNTSLALAESRKSVSADTTRTIYVAFPTAAPHIYISLSANNQPAGSSNQNDTRNLRALLQDAIPKAFSRPRERYILQSTALSSRSLDALLAKRGQGRGNAAGGGWSIYAEEKTKDGKPIKDTPLDQQLPTPEPSGTEDAILGKEKPLELFSLKRKRMDSTQDSLKRLKASAQARFGNSARFDDKEAIERLDIRIEDPFPSVPAAGDLDAPEDEAADAGNASSPDEQPSKMRRTRVSGIEAELQKARLEVADDVNEIEQDSGWVPVVRMTFYGSHVFAGIRELVECGAVDAKRMPGWMTGEEAVSIGVVKEGRILGFKGSGI